MKVLFMVRKVYYDQIVAGTKTEEIRKRTKRWLTVAEHLAASAFDGHPTIGVFLCGRRVHRRDIIAFEEHDSAEKYLGRLLSEQGKKDVGSGPVIVFYLGEAL